MPLYPRSCAERVRDLARFFPAVVLSGARQSGKTTLLQTAFPDCRYVTLDLPSVAEQAERNPDQFLAENPAPLLVDEVQHAPGLFRYLKVAIDADRHSMGRFILTGSQHFTLMRGVSESLAGRCGVAELENLSLDEIEPVAGTQHGRGSLLRLLVRGQFPELWRDRKVPARSFFTSYLATYLERDVRQILNVTSLRDFERFLRVLATRSANMLNKSDVARDVGVSVKAVGDWLSVLQTSGQIAFLEPWFANIGKRMVKTPKLYFRGSGLLCFLLNMDEQALGGSPLLGAVWETFVFAEMRKMNAASAAPSNIWYYRDQRAREIDFVFERGGTLTFVECKWSEHPESGDARQILAVQEDLKSGGGPWNMGSHCVVGTPAASYTIVPGVTAGSLRGPGSLVSTAEVNETRGPKAHGSLSSSVPPPTFSGLVDDQSSRVGGNGGGRFDESSKLYLRVRARERASVGIGAVARHLAESTHWVLCPGDHAPEAGALVLTASFSFQQFHRALQLPG